MHVIDLPCILLMEILLQYSFASTLRERLEYLLGLGIKCHTFIPARYC